MKYLPIVPLCGVLASCVSTVSEVEEINRNTVENSEQHLRLGYSMAEHYCDFGVWPKTLQKLKAFSLSDVTHLALPINWAWVERSGAEFEVSDSVTIRTRSEIVNGSVVSNSIISIHDQPTCSENGYGSKIAVSSSV